MSIVINATIRTWGYDLVSREDKVFTFFPSSHSICESTGHKVAKRCDFMRISFFNYLKQNYLMNQQNIRSGISDFSILSGHKMVCYFEIQVSFEVWDTRLTS